MLGDSSFGFAAFELETITKYNLNVLIVLFNNAGVYGNDRRDPKGLSGTALEDPSPQFIPQLSYEKLMQLCGGRAYACQSQQSLNDAMQSALDGRGPALINVLMDPNDGQENGSMH